MSMHTIDQAKNMGEMPAISSTSRVKSSARAKHDYTVSKKTGGTIDVCDAYLKDSANEEIKITLWAEDIEKISQGAKIKITNGYTSSFKGEIWARAWSIVCMAHICLRVGGNY